MTRAGATKAALRAGKILTNMDVRNTVIAGIMKHRAFISVRIEVNSMPPQDIGDGNLNLF